MTLQTDVPNTDLHKPSDFEIHQNDGLKSASDLTVMMGEFLERVSKIMLADFPVVHRWDDTGDISQQAALKLFMALDGMEVKDLRHLENLAATQIRRTLIDLARKYTRLSRSEEKRWTPHSPGGDVNQLLKNIPGPSLPPSQLLKWVELHKSVAGLPGDVREVFQLIWYQGLTKRQVSQLRNMSVPKVQRLWRRARMALAKCVDDGFQDSI